MLAENEPAEQVVHCIEPEELAVPAAQVTQDGAANDALAIVPSLQLVQDAAPSKLNVPGEQA